MEGLSQSSEIWRNFIGRDPFRKVIEFNPTLVTPETQKLMDWYFAQVDKLNDTKADPAPLTDVKDWVFQKTADGEQVESISRRDGNFWRLRGQRTQIGDFIFAHPVKESIEIPMKVKLFGKEQIIPVFGILIVVRDTEGKYLMTVGQETTADFHKKAMIRLPVQGSQGKLDLIFNQGKQDADPNLERNLRIITGKDSLSPKDLIEYAMLNGDMGFPIGADDTNFEIKHNAAAVWTVQSGSEKHVLLEKSGANMFLTKDQIEFASMAMLTNGHSERVVRLTEIFGKSSKPR